MMQSPQPSQVTALLRRPLGGQRTRFVRGSKSASTGRVVCCIKRIDCTSSVRIMKLKESNFTFSTKLQTKCMPSVLLGIFHPYVAARNQIVSVSDCTGFTDQETVDAPSVNAFKERLDKGKQGCTFSWTNLLSKPSAPRATG